jgi:hypothetical protein
MPPYPLYAPIAFSLAYSNYRHRDDRSRSEMGLGQRHAMRNGSMRSGMMLGGMRRVTRAINRVAPEHFDGAFQVPTLYSIRSPALVPPAARLLLSRASHQQRGRHRIASRHIAARGESRREDARETRNQTNRRKRTGRLAFPSVCLAAVSRRLQLPLALCILTSRQASSTGIHRTYAPTPTRPHAHASSPARTVSTEAAPPVRPSTNASNDHIAGLSRAAGIHSFLAL